MSSALKRRSAPSPEGDGVHVQMLSARLMTDARRERGDCEYAYVLAGDSH